MDLKEILKRHSALPRRTTSYISVNTGNSPAISAMFEKFSIRDLQLIRSLHLELTLEPASPDSFHQFLLDHIDNNISSLLESTYSPFKHDRNTEIGFENRKKMKSLLEILKWRAFNQIGSDEFFELYSAWLKNYGIKDLSTSQSSREINEVFTFFLLQEEEKEVTDNLALCIENMLDEVYADYSKRLEKDQGVSSEWNSEAESLFAMMDEDKKGHVEAEALQFWALSVLVTEVNCLEPILLRKQTSSFLQEMYHTHGIVTMRGWKNYLLSKGWKDPGELKDLAEKFQKVLDLWKKIRDSVLNSPTLASYQFLNTSGQDLPSVWNQCILNSLSFFPALKGDSEKIHKYLRFVGLQLGSTPSLLTKGVIYVQGTHIKEIPEFSIYLMNNYLQFSSQYHTSINFSEMTQQALNTLSADSRFQLIRKALQNYDNLLNIVLYELIASCPRVNKKTPSKSTSRLLYSSTTSILHSKIRAITPTSSMTNVITASPVRITKKVIKESASAPRIRKKEEKNSELQKTLKKTPTVIMQNQGRSLQLKSVFTKNTSKKELTKSASKSPARVVTKESYEEVMKRLNNK